MKKKTASSVEDNGVKDRAVGLGLEVLEQLVDVVVQVVGVEQQIEQLAH